MNEWDYLNNSLIVSPTEITELSILPVWWICQENLNHRYKIQVKEKNGIQKRIKGRVPFAKGHRRKQEHFVQFEKI